MSKIWGLNASHHRPYYVKFSGLQTLALGICLISAATFVAAQNPQQPQQQPQQPSSPMQGPQQQPQQQQPNNQSPNNQPRNGQSNGNPQVMGPPKPTALDRAKQELQKTQNQATAVPPLEIRKVQVPPAMVGDTITFTVNVYDRRSNYSTTFMYALQGNPPGSYVDPNSGVFTWSPQAPGQYSFYIWTADANDNTRQAFQQVTITVNPALKPFGYSLFDKARQVIDTRKALLRSGLFQGVYPITNGQYGSVPLTQGNPSQVYQGSTPSVFNPLSASSIFNPAYSSYLYGSGMNNAGSLMSQIQNQLAQQGMAYSQSNGQGPGSNNGQAPGFPGTGQGFMPPISPFGNLNNILPQQQQQNVGQNGQSMSQQMLQQYLSGSGGGIGSGAGGFGGQSSPFGQGGNSLGGGGFNGFGGSQQGPFGAGAAFGQSPFGAQQSFGSPNQQGGPGQNGVLNFPTPSYQSGAGGYGIPNAQIPFASAANGLSLLPSGPFANLNALVTTPGPTGLPATNPGLMANALQYLVGPTEEMGFNVYLPYPDRYQLGPGDALTLKVWSSVVPENDYDLTVDQVGRLQIPGDNEMLVVRGLTLGQAQNNVVTRVRKLLKGGKAQLTLKALRTMSIQVMGDAYEPGNYEVPAIATLFNTLMVCGGPDDNGSLRNIQLRRTNGTVKTFDLYSYLTRGDTSADVPLQPGDSIFIPPLVTRVNVRGEVERPAIYETMPGDTLQDLVKYAGGVTPTGFAKRAEFDTEEKGIGHIVKDIDLTSPNNVAQFFDQDTINVYTVPTDLLDDLNLKGAVRQEGLYQYRKGITVADLVRNGGGLLQDAYQSRADLSRQNSNKTITLIPIALDKALAGDASANVALEPHDLLTVYHQQDVKWVGERTVTVLGSVQRPGTYPRSDGEKVMDLLLQAGGVTGQAYTDEVLLQKAKPDGTAGELLTLDLKVLAADPSKDVALNDHDVLTIQSTLEAHYIAPQTVDVHGAVQAPGQYTRGVNMRVKDAIQEAGNIMPNAGKYVEIQHARVPDGTLPVRVSLSDVLAGDPNANLVLDDGDSVSVPGDSRIHLNTRSVIVVGRVLHPGAYTVEDSTRLSDVIAAAGGLMPDAFKRGAQLFRNPEQLKTDVQGNIGLDVIQMLQVVAQDEYTREMASADAEKVHMFQGTTSTSSLPIPGLGASSQTTSTQGPPINIWNEPLVTAARDLSNDLGPSGNVGINLATALEHRRSLADLQVLDQDIIDIPRMPSTVSVVGAVAVPSAIVFTPGHTVRFYLSRAGGFTDDAAKDRLILIHPGGLVQRANISTRMELGDQLLVPSKVMRAHLSDKAEEIREIGTQITAGAAVLAILRLLL